MYKLIQSHASNHDTFGLLQAGSGRVGPGSVLEKQSGDRESQLGWMESLDRIDPRVKEWLSKQPLDFGRYVYVLVVPLGADESWEETTNGDAFKREMLAPEDPEWGHKSFERYGNAFRNHRNKDPRLGFGDLPFTCFNDRMDRVEGIWRLDRQRADSVGSRDVVERIASTGVAEISMGCRVPYDVCSFCGNEAKTVHDYCVHPKSPGFGYRDDAGTYTGVPGSLMRVFNPWPKFFDLSDVRVPAAPEAHVLALISPEMARAAQEKTSSGGRFIVPASVLAAERYGLPHAGGDTAHYKSSSAADPIKLSDLIKRAPALEAAVIRPLQRDEPRLTSEVLEKKGASVLPLPTVLSSLAGLGIVCSPEELCDLVHACTGERPPVPLTREINEAWEHVPDEHPHVRSGFFNPEVASNFRSYVPDRSVLFPHLCRRVAHAPSLVLNIGAGDVGEDGPDLRVRVEMQASPQMQEIAAYVACYLKSMAHQLGQLLREITATYPQHEQHCLGAGFLTGPVAGEDAGGANGPSPAAFPASYILSYAGKGASPDELMRSVDALHRPGIEHLFGGLLATP